jgi:hypothetical protein
MNHNSLMRRLAKGLRLLFAAALAEGLALSAGPVRIAHTATSAEYAVVQQAVRCPDNAQSCFGDTNTTYGGDGSEDDYRQYGPSPGFVTWVEETRPAHEPTAPLPAKRAVQNSDITFDSLAGGNNYPFILIGHPPFNPDRVRRAVLRVDLFWLGRHTRGNDLIRFWDEQDTAGNYSTGYRFGLRVVNLLPTDETTGTEEPQWISLDLDLKVGTALAFGLDPLNGNRLDLIGSLGPAWPEPTFAFEKGEPQDVLELAADGTLFGLIEDDSYLSYVSLSIDADPQLEVDTTIDSADPAFQVCDPDPTNIDCSLRGAIIKANATPGRDYVFLPAGIYNLTILGDDEFGPSAAIGDLDILDDLNITGDGAGVTIIDGGRLTRSIGEYDRVFDVAPEPYLGGPVPDVTVNLSGMTIRNGKTRDVGGGIRYASALTVVDSVIRDNEAAMGGGLARAGFNFDDPRLTLMYVTVSGNRALSEHGGGIFALSSTSLTIQDSVIVDNRATNSGAGIHAVAVANPPTLTRVQVLGNMTGIGTGSRGPGGGIRGECLIITDSTINGNSANQGGGIFIGERPCPTVITHSTIGGNEADRDGGGILNFGNLSQPGGTLRVISSTISGNQAGEDGGGIANGRNGTAEVTGTLMSANVAFGNGGGISNEGPATLSASTLVSNTGVLGGGIQNVSGATMDLVQSTVYSNTALFGGGVYNYGLMRITNSTISHNDADKSGGGINAFRPGNPISPEDGKVLIGNSTIAFNRSDVDNPDVFGREPGGGVKIGSPEAVEIRNTLIANNTDVRAGLPVIPSDCHGQLESGLYNLVGAGNDGQGCRVVDSQTGMTSRFDQVGSTEDPIDPRLGSLADNGGPTLTHALLFGSPAIDRGNPAGCTDHGGSLITTDQRGVLRPLGRHCDIGAFEAYPFPQDRVLDDFTRPDGSRRLGPSWSGSVGGYIVLNPEVDVEGGGPIYWKANLFGARQEAFVTLARVDPAGQHQSLLLKVQDNDLGQPTWRRGAIAVFYRATEGIIGIETYVPGRGWHTLATFPMTLRDGDQLGARALADGTVEAYVNGRFVGEANAGSFFAGKGGRIGLWFIVAADVLLDDFGGGTVAP